MLVTDWMVPLTVPNTIGDSEGVSGVSPPSERAVVEEEFDSIMMDSGVAKGGGIQKFLQPVPAMPRVREEGVGG